ncbi:hypothetical protein V6N13_080187 [Hibiscus sabdariffa]|uniref:Uncharacterized protein n=1 Tax=Hibiscus sabdariffa TaxID=183260 RepID=A0ABR2PXK3_9ROSI
MSDVKPDSSSRQGVLGLGTGNFESENVKNPPSHIEGKTISDFKINDVKSDSSRGQGLAVPMYERTCLGSMGKIVRFLEKMAITRVEVSLCMNTLRKMQCR